MEGIFLLIRLGGLGDLLVALASIGLLRRAYPAARLTLVGRPGYASLLRDAGVIDDVLDGGGPEALRLFCASEPTVHTIGGGSRLTTFDRAVWWLNQKSPNADAGGSLLHDPGRSKIISYEAGSDKPMNRFFYEATIRELDIAAPADAAFEECVRLPVGSIPPGDEKSLARLSASGARKFAVLHPGSGGEAKRWRFANFFEIARRLKERGVSGVLVTGEAEGALEPEVSKAAALLEWAWLRTPSLASLARLLSRADLYLGNDSGITHLAACCGASTIALFLDDLLRAWRPAGRTRVLSAGSMDEISVESVWTAAAQELCI